MANNKFFLAKNGIATAGRGLFGTLTDNGTDSLQVSGPSLFSGQAEITNSIANTYSLLVRNTSNSHPANLAQFIGDSNSLDITNPSAGIYDIGSGNNVIRFGITQGLDLLYNGSSRLSITSTGNDFTGLSNTTIEGFRILTTADEGSGNGLDADTIDGLDSTQFLRSDEDDTMVGNLTIQGDLTVSGNTTYVDTETILLSDNIITLNANHVGVPTQDAGIEINRGTSANTYFLWNETNDEWTLDSNTTIDSLNPTFQFKGDDGNTYIITYNESATRMELGDDTNTNLYLNADGSAVFNYALSANSFTSVTTISAGSSITANTTITAGTDVIGQRFIDADNASYYVDPAATSVVGNVGIDSDLFHNGDTDTLIRFTDNDISLQTGGAERIGVADTRVDVAVDMYVPRIIDSNNNNYIVDPAGDSQMNTIGLDDYIIHNGDVNTYFGFQNPDDITFYAGGAEKVRIRPSRVDISVDLYAPRLLDSDNSTYLVDPAGTSQFNSADFDGTITGVDIDLTGDISGVNGTFSGDLVGFNLIANNDITAGNDITADGDLLVKGQINSWGDITSNTDIYAVNRMYAPQYRDLDNSTFYGDFASTSRMNNISLLGIIQFDSNSSTYLDFTGLNQFSIFTNGTENFRINDTYAQIFHQVRAPIYYDSNDLNYYGDFASVSNMSAINLNLRIQAWNNSGTNIDFDGTNQFRVITGGTPRFLVNDNNVDAIFNIRSPIFYDLDNTAYYTDPAGDSQLNTVDIDDYIRHRGDLNTYLGFNGSAQIVLRTDGVDRVLVTNTIVTSNVPIEASIFYDENDNSYYGDFAGISRVNDIALVGEIIHDGDADTYIHFPNTNEYQVVVGGANAISANTTVLSTDLDFLGNNITLTGDINAVNGNFSGDVTADGAMYAPRYYDSDDNNYYGDFASTSVLNKLHIGSTANLTDGTDPDISTTTIFATTKVVTPRLVFLNDASGDDNYLTVDDNNNAYTVAGQAMGAWWQFYGDKIGADTTNSSGLVASGVRTSYLEAKNEIWAPIYYDQANQDYYWNPNSANSHVFGTTNGTVNIGAEDPDYAHFRTDRPAFYFENTVYFDGNIRGFGGTEAAYFDFYYDLGDTSFFVDPQSSSRMNRINLVDKIRSASDTTNWIKFPGTDDFEIVTNSVRRFYVTNTYIESSVDFRAPRFIDYDDNNYYIDLTDTTTSMFAGGSIRQGIITNGTRWSDNSGNGGIALNTHAWDGGTGNSNIAVSGTAGGQAMVSLNRLNNTETNPWAFGGKYLDFLQDGSSIGSIAIESAGDNLFFLLNGSPSNPTAENGFQIWTGDTFIPIANFAHDGQIFFGNYIPVYTQNDNTPLVGSVSANKFHFEGGSLQLNGANDAIVFGAGTATFLKDEELAFGWGGGIYMTEGTTLRIRNGKDLSGMGGAAYFTQFIDYNDNNYYVNPAGDSELNQIWIDDYIRHRGDLNTYFGFSSADVITFQTNGVQRALIDANRVRARRKLEVYGSGIELQKDSNGGGVGITFTDQSSAETPGLSGLQQVSIKAWHADNSYTAGANMAMAFESSEPTTHYVFGTNANAAGGNVIPRVTNSGSLGLSTYRWGTVYAQTANFSGDVTGANAYFSRYYDADNNNYYGDFASKSIMNQIGLDDYIEHNGDTNTYIQFNAEDSWRVVTGGSARLLVNNSYVRATPEFRTPIMYDNDDTAWYVDPAGDSKLNEILLDTGEVRLRRPTGNFGSFEVNGGAVGSYEGFSIGGRSVFMHNNGTTSGIYNDVNNHWMILMRHGAVADAGVELRWNNVIQAEVNDGYFLAPVEARAPQFTDSDNTNFYVNPANESRLNELRTTIIYPVYNDDTTINISYPTGDYGSIQINGDGKGDWRGYSINGEWVFMARSSSNQAGIYNDVNNEWAIRATRNSYTEIYYNGTVQGRADNGYFRANNQMRAPVYYDTSTTSYYLNLGQSNTQTGLNIGSRINRQGFATSGDGDDNRLLVAQDYSHWIWNTATDWGIFWAGNDNPYLSYFSTTNPNEIVFIGNGNLRASIDLDDGNAFFGGEVYADNFNITGPGGNISLNPAYGSGGADLVLFDFTPYSEAELDSPIQGNEILTVAQSEYIEVADAPFAGKTIQTSAYRRIYSDYIPVVPGEDIYGEISVRYISGSGGLLYYGVERFDKDKNPIAGNTGTTYFVVSANNYTNTSWTTYRNHTTLPTSHTPYNGSDGGGVHYVRIRILLNYNSGGALRQFGGIMLKRRNVESNLLVDDILADDITADQINANIYYDRGDNDYYGDFASTSRMNVVDLNTIRAKDDTAYFIDPNADHSIRVYGEISNSSYANGNLQPGALNIGRTDRNYDFTAGSWASDIRSGIHANFSETWEMTLHDSGDEVNSALFYDGTDDLILGRDIGWGNMRISAPGNFYADRFTDINNNNFYAAPADESLFRRLSVTDTSAALLSIRREGSAPGNSRAAYFANEFANHSWGQVAEFRVENTTGGDRANITFSAGNANNNWGIGSFDNNDFGIREYHGFRYNQWGLNAMRIAQNTRTATFYGTQLIARNLYDYDDTNYYVDPASGSNLVNVTIDGSNINNAQELFWRTVGTYVYDPTNGTRWYWIKLFTMGGSSNEVILEYYAKDDVNYSGNAVGRIVASSWNNSSVSVDHHSMGGPENSVTPQVRIDNNRAVWIRLYSNTWDSFFRWRYVYAAGSGLTLEGPSYTRIDGGTGYTTSNPPPNSSNDILQGQEIRTNQGASAGQNPSNTRNYVGNLSTRSGGDVRASIFYDLDDTFYRLDANGLSRFSRPQVYSRQDMIGGAPLYFYTSAGALRGYIRATETNDSHFEFATSGGEDFIFRDGGFGGTWNLIIRGNGDVLTNRYHDAQRFRDRNNTGYYVDPASFSNLNTGLRATDIYARDWFRNDDSGQGLYNQGTGQHWYSDNDDGWNVAGGSSANWIRFRDEYAGVIRGYVYADNGNNIGFLNQGGGWALRTNNSTTEIYGEISANRFNDRDHPGYYVNPGSVSQLNYVLANNWFRAQGGTGFYFQSYGVGLRSPHSEGNPYGNVATYSTTGRGAWNGYGHRNSYTIMSNNYGSSSWSYGRYWGVYRLNPSRWLMLYDRASDRLNLYGGINLTTPYASRYYDADDPAYYGDFASTSVTRTIDNRGEIYNDGWFRNDVNGRGLYNTANAMHWYADNSSRWRLYSTSSTAQILFTTSGNTARGYVYADTAPSIGFLSSSGNWTIRCVADSYIYMYRSLYVPIIYDTSGSTFWRVDVSSLIRTPQIRTDTMYFARDTSHGYAAASGSVASSLHKIRYISFNNGSSAWNSYNYQGISSTDRNANWADAMSVNSYNDVSIRCDSNNNNTNTYFRIYNNTVSNGGTYALNYQMLGGSYFADFAGEVRGSRFTDINNSNYYYDPASTSNEAGRQRGGTLYGPNPTWGRYLAVGTNGHWSSSYASVATTNGNLHLDSQGGRNMYLQWYVGGTVYNNNSFQTQIMYDRNSTFYRWDGHDTNIGVRVYKHRAYVYDSIIAGGNSGIARSSYPYGFGFQESGGWSFPYPDMVFQYHTGMKFSANPSYEGMRFYNDYNSGALRFQINGGSGYSYKYTWLYTNRTSGYYTNRSSQEGRDWHIEPGRDALTAYGSMNVRGNGRGWYGISWHQTTGRAHIMFQNGGGGAGGLYWQSFGWSQYWRWDNFCQGIGTSATSSSYTMYVNGAIYATSNIVAYSDRRKKENIITIDGALEKVLKLRGVYYTLKNPEKVAEKQKITLEEASARRSGVIAQEVMEVLPEVVTYAEDRDEYGVDYGKMAGLFIEAIKDQQNIINNQQSQIEELKEMVNRLMEKI